MTAPSTSIDALVREECERLVTGVYVHASGEPSAMMRVGDLERALRRVAAAVAREIYAAAEAQQGESAMAAWKRGLRRAEEIASGK